MRDLHELPKLRDGLSYLYVEHGRVEQKQKAVEFVDKEGGCTMIPAAALAVLLLGPGTSITHPAAWSSGWGRMVPAVTPRAAARPARRTTC